MNVELTPHQIFKISDKALRDLLKKLQGCKVIRGKEAAHKRDIETITRAITINSLLA